MLPGRYGRLLSFCEMAENQKTMQNKKLIQAIATIALEVFPDAKWIAQDGDGRWYAYDVKPTNESGHEWLETSQTGDIVFVIELMEPYDSKEKLYEISEILKEC